MERRSVVILFTLAAVVLAIATAIAVLDRAEPPTAQPPGADSSTLPPTDVTTVATTEPVTTTVPDTTTTTTAPAPTLPPGASVCDLYGDIAVTGAVESADLVETSGLAAGRVDPSVLWSHNDSRDGARIYAMTLTGDDLGSFDVAGASAFDWEDMAAAAGTDGLGPYLYIGDIGDNFLIRGGSITVYRVPEPSLATTTDRIEGAVALEYLYPDGAFNAEALFVVEGSIYIVTKDPSETRVYRGDATGDGASVETLELVATLPLGAEVSAADISWDGTTIAFRGYRTVWMWYRTPGDEIGDVLAGLPCEAPSPEEIQGESIAFLEDGSYATTSEGTNPILHVVAKAS